MPLPKVCEAPKTAEFSTDSSLKNGNKSVEKSLHPTFGRGIQYGITVYFFSKNTFICLHFPWIGCIVLDVSIGASPSSRGLGHQVLILVTWVRIPLGMPAFPPQKRHFGRNATEPCAKSVQKILCKTSRLCQIVSRNITKEQNHIRLSQRNTLALPIHDVREDLFRAVYRL